MFNVNTAIETQQSTLDTNTNSNTANGNNPSESHSQFHEQKLVQKFCRVSQLGKLIEGTVNTFLCNYRRTRKPEEALAPLLLRLDFNYSELVEHAPQLLNLVIEEPLQFDEAVKYSVYGQVRDLLKSNTSPNDISLKAIDIAQLHTQWRLVDLPLQPSLVFDPSQRLYPLGLALVDGILSAYTLPEAAIGLVLRQRLCEKCHSNYLHGCAVVSKLLASYERIPKAARH